MIPDNNFDPYSVLLETQKNMVEIAELQNEMSNHIVQLYTVLENLNRRQDILNAQLNLVNTQQKSPAK